MTLSAAARAEAGDILAEAFSGAAQENPYPFWKRLRDVAPVHLTPTGACYVTSHAEGNQVFKSRDFSSTGRFEVYGPDWRDHLIFSRMDESIAACDPPKHTRLRTLVSYAFTARHIEGLRSRIATVVDDLLDDLAAKDEAGESPDFVESFAVPFPVAVIGELMGISGLDKTDVPHLATTWARGYDPAATAEVVADADSALGQLCAIFDEIVAERRAAVHTGEDLISTLLTASVDGDRLSPDELLTMLVSVCTAGFVTTTQLLANSVVTLCRAPDQARLVREDPSVTITAVEEFLRYDSVIQFVGRTARRDTELGGVSIPAKTPVTLIINAANHDPLVFDQPERLDLRRRPNPHLAFTAGVHHCLGSQLARVETQIALPALLRRFPELSLAGAPMRSPGMFSRGYDSVPLAMTTG